MRVLFASLLLLAACQSSPENERGRTVTVRMTAGSQVIAERECGGPARPIETRQGTNQIVYLCVAQGAAPAAPTQPQTVSVPVSSDAENVAARQCGSPVRPETVHHESNVVTFRCLRGEP